MDVLSKLKSELNKLQNFSYNCGEEQSANPANSNLVLLLQDKHKQFPGPELPVEQFTSEVSKLLSRVSVVQQHETTTEQFIYNMLVWVFRNTTQEQRQEHFHHLIQHFYESNIKKRNISWVYYEERIKNLLPLAKVSSLKALLKAKLESEEIDSLSMEIYESVKCRDILREDCYKIHSQKFSGGTWRLVSFDLSAIEGLSGTLGSYFTLTTSVTVENKPEKFQFFAKYLPLPSKVDEGQLKLATASFKKEEFFYGTFIQRLKNLGYGEILDFSPTYYFSRRNDVLVLEDLTPLGYKMSDIAELASFQWLSLSIEALAKLHACTILLEERISEDLDRSFRLDEEYEEYFEEVLVFKENCLYDNSAVAYITFFIDQFSSVCTDMSLSEFKERARKLFDSMYTGVKKSNVYRNVISHGDMWASNVLYKGNSQFEPSSCKLIDFQLIKYCSPAFDPLVLIYTHTTRDIREKYLEKLLDTYYNKLTQVLSKCDINISKIYPRSAFERSCEDMRGAALCAASLFVEIFVCPSHILPLNTNDPVAKTNFLTGDRSKVLGEALKCEMYRSRILDCVKELYDMCKNIEGKYK